MVAQFLGLKLRLMANTFRRSPWQVFGLVIGLLYGMFLAVFVVLALVGARFVGDVELIRNVLVVLGALVMLGFVLLPLIFGVDDTLDPRRFSLYGIPNLHLASYLALAALIGTPALVLTVCSLATVVTWSRDFGTTLIALVCAVIVVLTCVLSARVTTSIAAFLLSTRRAREFSGAIGILVIVMLSPVIVLLATIDWARDGVTVIANIASWLSWTPLGAMWSVPGDAATGAWGVAFLKLLIALGFLGLLWLGWMALVAKMLVTPHREAQAKAYAGLGWFSRVPAGATAAIAARSLTYWGRDARYWVSLVMIPLVPVVMVVALLIAGVPGHYIALLPLPVMCLFLGWMIHNDLAYDSTAIWLHIASGTHGIADRVGRIVPVILIGIPLIAVGSIVTVYVYGDWVVLPSVIGLSGAVLLIGIGLSSISSAVFPYPASKPGDSAFSQPQNLGASAALVQSISFFAVIVLSAPIIVFMALGLFVSPGWLAGTPIAAAIIGLAVLVGGLFLGGWVFDRRAPELMGFASRND
ncbi:MAG: type transport system permease protein [Microbacteriaceae bacterium]|nr:type transport system permease protein [Microbacteriaceae bacterium]